MARNRPTDTELLEAVSEFLEADVESEIARAVEAAEASPFPTSHELLNDVFAS